MVIFEIKSYDDLTICGEKSANLSHKQQVLSYNVILVYGRFVDLNLYPFQA